MTTLYLFPDTNLFLQCQGLESLDWSALGAYDNIEVMISRPVQSELDRQKKLPGRVGKKARAANTMIGKLLDAGFLDIRPDAPKVRLTMRLELKYDQTLDDELDYNERDDQLIGIAHAFAAANSGGLVEVLSDDNGVRATANRVGVGYRAIPEKWLLDPEADVDEKRLNALQRDLDRYKNAEPKFEARSEPASLEFKVSAHRALTDDQVARLMAKLQSTYPKLADFNQEPPPARPPGIGLAAAIRREVFKPATPEEFEDYTNNLYPQWLEKCELIFRNLHLALDGLEPLPIIKVSASNVGSRPAQDAAININSLGKIRIAPQKNDEDGDDGQVDAGPLRLPPVPRPPEGRWIKQSFATDALFKAYGPALGRHPAELLQPLRVPRHDPEAFYWRPYEPEVPSVSLRLTCDLWRHQAGEETFGVQTFVDRVPGKIGGAVEFVIHAANLTDPFIAKIPVLFDIDEADAYEDAEALIDLLKPPNPLG